MEVILGRHAREEFLEAIGWYSERSRTSAMGFLAAYQEARERISSHPDRWPELEPGVRRVLLRRYPYSLLYVIEDDHVLILAVMHQRRDPGYWHDRR